ncbi:WD repeat domain-containing protein [Capsaspora owczarzaki ATCC 30864]|uniref:WD repeat domain-containing protein n=1 Tax=Capsaspora owczarzaki (strain ATCC 30864) TaxID=595528 RepID=A0A0D2VM15_CAPO3|nr:WD repeat domain-containing protein [Capsaspora owczarzaki ATCC 30864]KJE91137.1 WD repeat domain-containing protein [Capsaspora owczarzaki ATCC 30864]|eukprot:XP_004349067.1 WD repeat domain-containing protein [Capsaspora owczarzaki ATCC 30864]
MNPSGGGAGGASASGGHPHLSTASLSAFGGGGGPVVGGTMHPNPTGSLQNFASQANTAGSASPGSISSGNAGHNASSSSISTMASAATTAQITGGTASAGASIASGLGQYPGSQGLGSASSHASSFSTASSGNSLAAAGQGSSPAPAAGLTLGASGPISAATTSTLLHPTVPMSSFDLMRRLAMADPKRAAVIAATPVSPLRPGANAEQHLYAQANASLPMTMVCTVNGPINSFSTSPDGTMVAVAGRDVLKVLSMSSDRCEEVYNMRSGTRVTLNYSSIDVCWHPLESYKNIMATAATNGAVVLWDITHAVSRSSRVLTEHTRTVNRVTFHPSDPHLLLSGSQDGSVKVWDTRNTTKSAITFDGRSESIRDIQFNPFDHNLFATASETGLVQLWDMRKHESCERRISSHHGPAFTVDWHPEDRYVLATGGRDKTIKVWELSGKPHTFANIQTIAAVTRVAWRPGFRWQLASAALLTENSIHLWDLHRPSLPVASFQEHRDAVTRIAWRNSSSFLSSAKDSTLIVHSFRDAVYPADSVNPVSLSWSPRGDLGFVSVRERDVLQAGAPLPIIASMGPHHVLTGSQIAARDTPHPSGANPPFVSQLFNSAGGEYSPFICRPKQNRRGRAVVQDPAVRIASGGLATPSSNHVATADSLATSLSRTERAMTAMSVSSGTTPGAASAEFKFPDYVAAISNGETAPNSALDSARRSGTVSPFSPASVLSSGVMSPRDGLRAAVGAKAADVGPPALSVSSLLLGFDERVFQYLANHYKLHGEPVGKLCEHNAGVANACHQVQVAQSWQILKLFFATEVPVAPAIASEDLHAHPNDSSFLRPASAVDNDDPHRNFNMIDQEPVGFSLPIVSDQQMVHELMADSSNNWVLQNEVIERLTPISSRPSSPTSKHSLSRPMSPTLGMNGQSSSAAKSREGITPDPASTSALGTYSGVPNGAKSTTLLGGWNHQPMVVALLHYYAERGDVQTAVTMLTVLNTVLAEDAVPSNTQEQWYIAYIDLLHRFELYSIAADVMRSSTNTTVQGLNQDTTTVHTSCSNCKKPLFKSGWVCDRCLKLTNSCSVCHQTVKGLYVWCQGCGHGGHITHMQDWFSKHTLCPAGCLHHCEFI